MNAKQSIRRKSDALKMSAVSWTESENVLKARNMKEEPGYLKHIMDRLSPLGEISSKYMFGGWGVFTEGLMFAVFAGDSLYFKVDDSNRQMYEKAGSTPFPHGISYWEVPEEVAEDDEKLRKWAQISIDIARRKAAKKKKK